GMSRWAAIATVAVVGAILLAAGFWFVRLAPPRSITLTSGPPGSIFQNYAGKYRQILGRNRIDVKIVPSEGSAENLKRLSDPTINVDIGFAQAGTTNDVKSGKVVSLGSVAHQPLLVIYRATNTITLVSQLKGKRLAIGPVGSGTRNLALLLLAVSGIETNK